MKRIIFVTAIVSILLCSCAKPEKITIVSFDRAEMKSLSRFDLHYTVQNASSHDVEVKSAKFTVNYGDNKLIDILLPEPVGIRRKSISTIVVPIRMKVSDPMILMSFSTLDGMDLTRYTVTGEAVVKSGMGRKKIKFDKHPLSQILAIFGLTSADMKELTSIEQ